MKNLVLPSLGAFVSLFFPRLCPACMNPLLGKEKVICFNCQMSLPQTDHPWDFENILWKKMNQLTRVERAVALFEFQKNSKVESMLYQLKYNEQVEIGSFLGNWLAPQLKKSKVFAGVDAVLPVPLHPVRERQRGYNQIQLFSECLAHNLGLPLVADFVYRKKQTQQLAKLQKSDRLQEIVNAFALNKNQHYPAQHWLLVDDVITTGATILSCGNTILEACGGRISIVSLASRLS